MDVFDILTLIGGLSLFLFGMNIMGQALERRAGSKLRSLLGKLTTKPLAGLLTGLCVTAVIQSSSATTVMVVGFVNSGLMTLAQSINVIMGANIGTTVTAWILSLGQIEGDNLFVQLLKPTSFTPVLALLGIVLYMFCKGSKKRDTGVILLGFATLMFGMDTMSGAVSGLSEVPAFRELFIMFQNPILGVLAGAILTAIIQSSSGSVGILQALAVTGQVTYGAAIPIIMGQNIGTCITALLSAVGTTKNAKRAAIVHLSFNVIGTVVWLAVFSVVRAIFTPAILGDPAERFGIAVVHSVFNLLCVVLLFPMAKWLEKLVKKIVPDSEAPETVSELDDRLLNTPPIALERCRKVAEEMAMESARALKSGISSIWNYTEELAESVRELEERNDHYEDILSTYLLKLSMHQVSDADHAESAKILKVIGDAERISDHSVNLVESAEEIREKELKFSPEAIKELQIIGAAVEEIIDLSLAAFLHNDMLAAQKVEPLEEVIDSLKEQLRTNHILRLQQGNCSIEAGFVLSDILTNLERTSDHCSNIAGCVADAAANNMNLHESLRNVRVNADFAEMFEEYESKYSFAGLNNK
ncbi:MAG: Na/Pi cotransporter family protein [Clostridia bacterium]|nr:Na/Pi cotransporter family protein [Clostridia bacterium]